LKIGGAAIAAGVLQANIPTIMAYTGTYFEVLLQNVSIPIGQISAFAGASAPTGWLLCDGSSQSTTGPYAALHGVIGYTYGGSGGSFNIPDLLRRAPVGKGASDTLGSSDGVAYASRSMSHNHTIGHTHTIPNHQHTVPSHQHDIGTHTHTVNSHGHTVNAHGHTLSDAGYALMYLQNATPGVWAARRLVTGVNTWTATAGGTTSTIGGDSGTYSRAIALGGSTDLASPGTSSESPGTGGPQTSNVTGGVTAFLTNAGEGGVTTNSQSTSTSGANTQQHLFVNYIIKF
jgi:microcystin-dependent protein